MDNKTWLWRKRSSEKTIVATPKSDFSSKGNEEEMLPNEKELSLQRSLGNLNEKLALVLYENKAKDDLLARHAKMEEEAIAGREKAEAAAVSLKQELDEALQQKLASNERLSQINVALKESMQQLTSVREEQEQRIRDAVMKTSREFEKAQKKLEEKLSEKSKRLANLTAENTHLNTDLLAKEKLIEDLSKHKSQAEAEFNTLMARLDSVEKENAFLKYEFRMLEKELEIRNEEIEFNRQSADVSHKQHLESVKKVTKLEAECQRLRVLVRKRLPGPAALATMKGEVEILGRNQSEMGRRKLNPVTGSLFVRDTTLQNHPDISNKKINFLVERLCDVEAENKTLKEILAKKDEELHSSHIVCSQTASKLSKLEAQVVELSKSQKCMELATLSSIPGLGTNNELEHFRNWKPETPNERQSFGGSDMSLMDDFVEMEKLAIVTVGSPLGNSCASSDAINALAISSEELGGYHLDARGKELVPVAQGQSSDNEREIQTKDVSTQKGYDWLQNVLNLIFDQSRVSNRSFVDLLEDIRLALTYMKHSCASEANREENSVEPGTSEPIPISGYITWKSPNASPSVGSLNGVPQSETSVEEKGIQHVQSNLSRSIRKIVELIRRIDPTCTVLERFVHTCEDLLDGKVKLENFAAELSFALDWIINHCIVSQDVLSVGEKIGNHLGLDKLPNASENFDLQEENRGLKDELKKMEFSQKELEARLWSANDRSEALTNQLREMEKSIGYLETELKTLKESKGIIEDQFENQKLINEDLDTQLSVAKAKLNEVFQKLSSLEVELDDKSHCCEELEATCLELQLQLESFSTKEVPKDSINQDERLLQTGWEITAASAKLAECQETIINLGRQLKVLSSSRETSVSNRRLRQQRSSLRDQLLAEDGIEAEDLKSPKTKEVISTVEARKPSFLHSNNNSGTLGAPEAYFGFKQEDHTAAVGSLAIVPSTKRRGGVGFLRKLLMRKKRGSSKKTHRSFAT